MTKFEYYVLKAVYDLSDEIDYNTYESADIAEYLHRDVQEVEEHIAVLHHNGYLSRCMTREDDGVDTYILTKKAQDEMGL